MGSQETVKTPFPPVEPPPPYFEVAISQQTEAPTNFQGPSTLLSNLPPPHKPGAGWIVKGWVIINLVLTIVVFSLLTSLVHEVVNKNAPKSWGFLTWITGAGAYCVTDTVIFEYYDKRPEFDEQPINLKVGPLIDLVGLLAYLIASFALAVATFLKRARLCRVYIVGSTFYMIILIGVRIWKYVRCQGFLLTTIWLLFLLLWLTLGMRLAVHLGRLWKPQRAPATLPVVVFVNNN